MNEHELYLPIALFRFYTDSTVFIHFCSGFLRRMSTAVLIPAEVIFQINLIYFNLYLFTLVDYVDT